jgi:hypothetical protein
MHDFILGPVDTDSISMSKKDMSPFSKEEQKQLLDEINSMMPEKIQYEHDGYFSVCIVLKAKNYILWEGPGTKPKYKGSALKSSKIEPALSQFMKDIIQTILDDKHEYEKIYNDYVIEILNVKDIKRWAGKKTLTDKVLNPQRTNEQKVLDAIQGSEYVEGAKIYTYFKSDNSLSLIENFDGDYNKDKLLEKLFKTSKVFDNIIDTEAVFKNYKLKKNKKELLDKFPDLV